MVETRDVEVTSTFIQRFDCGCTTTINATVRKKRPQLVCNAHQGLLASEEIVEDYAAHAKDGSTSRSVARSRPGT